MFGKSKKQEEVLPDINDMSFEDLVSMGLVDDEIASSLGNYLGKDKTLKELQAEDQKPTTSQVTKEKTVEKPVEKMETHKTEETPVKPVISQPSLTVLTGPQVSFDEASVSPLGDALRENDNLKIELRDAKAKILQLQKDLETEKSGDTSNERQELADILIEARMNAKKEVADAKKQAEQIVATAQANAARVEQESKQRQEILQSHYQKEQELLKAKFQQMQEYFNALKGNADLLFTDYLTKTEQIIKELDED